MIPPEGEKVMNTSIAIPAPAAASPIPAGAPEYRAAVEACGLRPVARGGSDA